MWLTDYLPLFLNCRAQLLKIISKKEGCKVLGTSTEEETKLACASIAENFGDEF